MARILLITATLALAGCETVAGLGRDITRTADAVDNALL